MLIFIYLKDLELRLYYYILRLLAKRYKKKS
jgi:hypothetical protein